MTYRSTYTAQQQAAVDASVVGLTAVVAAFDADNDTLTALQAEYDAYRQAHPDEGPTPPPVTALLVGVTKHGQGRSAWDVIRTYNNSDAGKVPQGMTVATSFSSWSKPGWRNDAAQVARMRNELAALRDQAGTRVDHMHEPENDYGENKSGADNYVADSHLFASLVADANTRRAHPFIINKCFMGYNLTKNGQTDLHLWLGDPNDYGEIGIDVYGTNQIGFAVDFADEIGKPLCVPEMGPMSNVDHTDEAITPYMQQGIEAYRAAGATWVAWFDKSGAGADLDQYPNGLDYWSSQTTTALAGTP
jgi:hypothetical protein